MPRLLEAGVTVGLSPSRCQQGSGRVEELREPEAGEEQALHAVKSGTVRPGW